MSIICEIHNITQGNVVIGLDGSQALETAAENWKLHAGQADYDMLTDIRRKVAKLPIDVGWHWIRGHQDDHQSTKNLDIWERNNVAMDTMAKEFWKHLKKCGYTPQPARFSMEGWAITIDGQKQSRVDKNLIYKKIFGRRTKQYWRKKTGANEETVANIDWISCGKAFQGLKGSKQRLVLKHASGHMACGNRMQLWGFQEGSECPRCQHPDETPEHVLHCPDQRAQTAWTTTIRTLETWMIKNETDPDIIRAITTELHRWKQPHLPTRQYKPSIATAVQQQGDIGWYQFLMGKLTMQWTEVQDEYLKWLGRRRTGKAWVTALIAKVWTVSWDMWEHRNDIHHNTITPKKLLELTELKERITEQMEKGTTGLMQKDHHLVHIDHEKLQAYTPEQKRQWLASVELAREQYIHRATHRRSEMRQQREYMERWLHQRSNNPPLSNGHQTP